MNESRSRSREPRMPGNEQSKDSRHSGGGVGWEGGPGDGGYESSLRRAIDRPMDPRIRERLAKSGRLETLTGQRARVGSSADDEGSAAGDRGGVAGDTYDSAASPSEMTCGSQVGVRPQEAARRHAVRTRWCGTRCPSPSRCQRMQFLEAGCW